MPYPIPIYPFIKSHLPCDTLKPGCFMQGCVGVSKPLGLASVIITVSAGILTGCSDLSAQTAATVPATTETSNTYPHHLDNEQATDQNPEPRSIWVTLANMRCH